MAEAAPSQFEILKSTLFKELEALDHRRQLEGESEDQHKLSGHMGGHLRNAVMIAMLDSDDVPHERVKNCIKQLELFSQDLKDTQQQYGQIPDVQAVLDTCLLLCSKYTPHQTRFKDDNNKGAGGGKFYR